METRRRRRQYRSCDQCRKGKRACDGEVPDPPPEIISSRDEPNISSNSPCSNCTKWRKACTYNWLSTAPPEPCKKKPRRNTAAHDTAGIEVTDALTNSNLYQQPLNFMPSLAEGFERSRRASNISDRNSSLSSNRSAFTSDGLDGSSPEVDTSGPTSFSIPILHNPFSDGAREIETWPISTSYKSNAISPSASARSTFRPSPRVLKSIDYDDYLINCLLESDETSNWYAGAARDDGTRSLSSASNDLSDRFERSALVKNMFRIYNDSMENALSCWLAEQCCPYSMAVAGGDASRGSLPNPSEPEKGSSWPNSVSNRVFSRVLRLDHAFGTSKGQQLTVVEDKKASRALLSTIMAFASQWATQPSQRAGTFTAGILSVIAAINRSIPI